MMNANRKIKLTNTILFSAGILFFITSYYQLQLSSQQSKTNQNIIGYIENLQNDIRLKSAKSFEWFPIDATATQLSENDKVFSNINSHAVIKLNLGSEILLKQQSLIKIKSPHSISIQQGEVSLKLKKNNQILDIYLGDKKIQITPLINSEVTISDQKTLKIDSGKVKVTQNKRKLILHKDEILEINQTKKKQTLKIISPKEILYTQSDKLAVELKHTETDLKVDLILAKDSQFQSLIEVPVSKKVRLPPGQYFWKLNNQIEKFKIIQKLKTPTIISPSPSEHIYSYLKNTSVRIITATKNSKLLKTLTHFSLDNQIISEHKFIGSQSQLIVEPGKYYFKMKISDSFIESDYGQNHYFEIIKLDYHKNKPLIIELKKPNQKVKFEWNKKAKELSVFELAKDASFNDIISKKRIRSKNFTHITFPVLGRFYWRARKANVDGSFEQLKPRQIIITPGPPPKKPKALPRLKIKLKQKNSSFFSKLLNIIIPSAHAAQTEHVIINFPSIDNAKNYEIEIYSDNKLHKKVYSTHTNKTRFKWTPPQAGIYYWRIRYTDFWKRISEFSKASTLNIEISKITKVKRPTKKKKTVITKTIKPPTEKKLQYILKLAIAPSLIDFTETDTDQIKVKGEVYNSIKIGAKKKYITKYFKNIFLNYDSHAGKVFENKQFYIRHLNFGADTHFYNLSPAVLIKQISTFDSTGTKISNGSDLYTASVGAKVSMAIKVGKKHNLTALLAFYAIMSKDLSIELDYQYHWKNDFNLILGLTSYKSDITSAQDGINYQYFQLFSGLEYQF
ncbi:MAG: hypothetical protein HON90_09025 [Halobacteriovoraceae bacterium]|jgi:hypothetical protein|nr:hypothetical protein [Halobacteriovoraceae bacterium]